jgi:hypothetical protein
MQNKSIWKDLPPIYVNFAMKKSERLELLHKKREETFKNAQKMTIFSKIKDENAVKSEEDFIDQIKNYLKNIFQKEYEPRSIKVRFETKNAFITMNSQRDSEEFIRKFQEYAKENQTSLYFNLYKSKVDRNTANSYFKKFNMFNAGEDIMGAQARYRKYNQAVGQPGQQEFPYSAMNQQGPIRYNNFEDMNQMGQMSNQPRYVSYNQFPQQMMQKENKFQAQGMTQMPQMPQMNQVPKFDPTDEDSIGEYLYNFVEKIYPEHASKITGMLMETDPSTRFKLINSRPEELTKIIHTAHNQLLSQ